MVSFQRSNAGISRVQHPGDYANPIPTTPATAPRCKLDPHRDFLLALIEATPDLTISELLERLLAERGIKASRATLWGFLDRCGLTFKKRPPMRASRIERM